jgi:Transglycosylase-like domain
MSINPSRTSTRPNPGLLATAIALLALAAALLAVSMTTGPDAAKASGGIGTTSSNGHSSGNRSGEAKYERIWDKVSKRNKRWARRTSKCESGGDPKAIGGGGRYRGAFQFMKSTWRSSPKSPGGDPIDYRYKTQAVVAVKLKIRDGAGHWPVCG